MFMYFWKRRTDAEHIEMIRRQIRSFDRFRPWLIAIWGILFLAFLTLSVALPQHFANKVFANNPGQAWLGFVNGFVFGSAFGLLALKTAHGLVLSIVTHRNERLLLRYYDAFQAIARGEIIAPPVGGDESRP